MTPHPAWSPPVPVGGLWTEVIDCRGVITSAVSGMLSSPVTTFSRSRSPLGDKHRIGRRQPFQCVCGLSASLYDLSRGDVEVEKACLKCDFALSPLYPDNPSHLSYRSRSIRERQAFCFFMHAMTCYVQHIHKITRPWMGAEGELGHAYSGGCLGTSQNRLRMPCSLPPEHSSLSLTHRHRGKKRKACIQEEGQLIWYEVMHRI